MMTIMGSRTNSKARRLPLRLDQNLSVEIKGGGEERDNGRKRTDYNLN